MKKCAFCKSWILFGGRKDGTLNYCNDKCQQQAALVAMAATIPTRVVEERVWAVHQGLCPRCHNRGPVDVHMSYRVWSALIVTSWSNQQQVSCRSCAVKTQLIAIGSNLILGWWGFPWGLIMTPVQVTRDVIALAKPPAPAKPSPRLETMVRMGLAQDAIATTPVAKVA
jgi:hypothetical protein